MNETYSVILCVMKPKQANSWLTKMSRNQVKSAEPLTEFPSLATIMKAHTAINIRAVDKRVPRTSI